MKETTETIQSSTPIMGMFPPIPTQFRLTFTGPSSYTFAPQDDMTPVEAAWIAMLFTLAANNNSVVFKPGDFIAEHKLERHFK